MVKRDKKVRKGVESLKEEIEKHFYKIEQDISENNLDRGRYHIKEIDKSLLKALEIKLEILEIKDKDLEAFKKRLEELKKKIEI